MYGSEPKKVVSFRFSEEDLKMLDALVAAEPQPESWWDPKPSRSTVIRSAIAHRHTLLEGGNTKRSRRKAK